MLKNQSEFTIYENDQLKNYFDYHIYFFKYEGIIRETILKYKFRDKSYLYKTFTNFFIKNEKFCRFLENYDIIIPVPISKKRNKERGYNQSGLIATDLSKKLDLELVNNCLYKTKNVIEQSKLSKEEREDNIQGVYSLKNSNILIDKKILLVDDIFTTGSTVNECCKVLRQENIREITVLTIAKD
ncbi:MAG: ComF family protein [Clostridia bacterium]|nr:ComF family protein [Clostridia bacterium]